MTETPHPVPPTTDALRHAIDSGRAGDKINFPDPAAAPLGTDDEAAGAAPGPDAVRQAIAAEIRAPSPSPTRAQMSTGGSPLAFLLALIAFIATSVVAAIIVLR